MIGPAFRFEDVIRGPGLLRLQQLLQRRLVIPQRNAEIQGVAKLST